MPADARLPVLFKNGQPGCQIPLWHLRRQQATTKLTRT